MSARFENYHKISGPDIQWMQYHGQLEQESGEWSLTSLKILEYIFINSLDHLDAKDQKRSIVCPTVVVLSKAVGL